MKLRSKAIGFELRKSEVYEGRNMRAKIDNDIGWFHVIDQVAKGNIPKKITRTYQADFDEMRKNLNTLIENLKDVLKEMDGLIISTPNLSRTN